MTEKQIYEFGPFRLDPGERLLLRGDTPVALTPKAFDTLVALVENSGHLIKKDDLMKRVWPGTFVEEVNLAQNVSAIRRALDTDGEQYIETVPKIGYRLVVKARVLDEGPAEPAEQRLEEAAPAHRKPAAAIVTIAVVLAGVALLVWKLRPGPTAQPAGVGKIQSIAVLPLENLSRDPEQEYFADGMTDALITDLAKIHALRVISRTSVMRYKGKPKSLPQIARELNVDAIVEGTVMRSGDRVRITAQLIDAPQDRHLWADTYERDLRDVLALQDDVAKAIAGEIKITLTPPEQTRLSNARPVNPAAHEAYLRGLFELHGLTAEPTEAKQVASVNQAIGYFQQAIAYEPNDALAYAGLADALSSLSTFERAPLEVMPKAKAAATKATELDDTLAEAHASLGYLAMSFDWDWARAEREFRRAIELNPSSARAHGGYAQYLLFIPRRPDESMKEMQQAYALDPLLPQAHGDMSWFLFLARRYQESIEAAQKVGHDEHIIALSHAELGQAAEAVGAGDRAAQSTTNPVIRSQIAAAYALAGSKDKARAMLNEVTAQAQKRYVCGFNVACLYAVLGEKEKALAWLDRAYRDRSD